jgi:cell division protein FtsI (penicillin-binding protein 3)
MPSASSAVGARGWARRGARHEASRQRARRRVAKRARSVNYATSPLLASKTPPWRSRFSSRWSAWASCVLARPCVYVQIIGTDFYQKQGEKRYARTLDLPASRGRIVDRNGQVLATSVPAPSLWAIPKDFKADAAQRKAAGEGCWA